MLQTLAESKLVRSVGVFYMSRLSLGAEVSLGPGFSSLHNRFLDEEESIGASATELFEFSKSVRLVEAIRLLGKRWKPVRFSHILSLLDPKSGAPRAFTLTPDTFFRIKHQLFRGIVFVTHLEKSDWFMDAIPEADISGHTLLAPQCRFGVPR